MLITTAEWTSLPSLHTLKVSRITLEVYKAILIACPNLVYFELSMFNPDISESDIKPHLNLKQLVIDVADMIYPWDDDVFNSYLSCAPNLEQFIVYRTIFVSKITESLFEYDWLASKIALYLFSLRQFKFYFKLIRSKLFIESNIQNILCQLEEIFLNNHNNRYQSRLIINR